MPHKGVGYLCRETPGGSGLHTLPRKDCTAGARRCCGGGGGTSSLALASRTSSLTKTHTFGWGFHSAHLAGLVLGPAGAGVRNGGIQLCSSLAQLSFSEAGHTEGSTELLKETQPCEAVESKASNGAAWMVKV